MAKKVRASARKGSGNIFVDLGLPNPEQELLKAQLTLQIYKIVKARGLTQAQAGTVLGIKQPHVSALMRNSAGNFSVGRLMEFLTALGQDVEITVKPTRKARGVHAGSPKARRNLTRHRSIRACRECGCDGGFLRADGDQ